MFSIKVFASFETQMYFSNILHKVKENVKIKVTFTFQIYCVNNLKNY